MAESARTVLVSNNSELLRHLAASPLRRLSLEVAVTSTGAEAVEAVEAARPALAILDAEMPDLSGYDVSRRIKDAHPECKVLLVLGRRLTADQMRRVTASGCDEVLIAPMTADELYDVVALQLGFTRRGSERYALDLAVVTDDGQRTVDGRVTNLSLEGARLILPEAMGKGTRIGLTITPDESEVEPITLAARIVWSESREDATVAGACFEAVTDEQRSRLSRLIHWEIVDETERIRVVIKGDITEATRFDDLLPALIGRVDFDFSQVRYINSLGVKAWVDFLGKARVRGYEFHACSIPFILQASLIRELLGSGSVASFFAPYQCRDCGHSEERLLQSAAILATDGRDAPTFGCPSCGGDFLLDDDPDHYLAFLRED